MDIDKYHYHKLGGRGANPTLQSRIFTWQKPVSESLDLPVLNTLAVI